MLETKRSPSRALQIVLVTSILSSDRAGILKGALINRTQNNYWMSIRTIRPRDPRAAPKPSLELQEGFLASKGEAFCQAEMIPVAVCATCSEICCFLLQSFDKHGTIVSGIRAAAGRQCPGRAAGSRGT